MYFQLQKLPLLDPISQGSGLKMAVKIAKGAKDIIPGIVPSIFPK